MHSALNLYHHTPPAPAPPLSTALRRHRNAPYQPQFHMPVADLSLRRIASTTPLQTRFNRRHKELFSLKNDATSIHAQTMADAPKKTEAQPGSTAPLKVEDGKQSESEKSESKPAIPPPPEKPLPGDCCGSGCVSCVWDLYYEELEEYNKLYKAK